MALIVLFVSQESNRPWNAEFVPRVLRHWLRPSELILSWLTVRWSVVL